MPEQIWVQVEAEASGEDAKDAAERAIDRVRAEGVHGPQISVKATFDGEQRQWMATASGSFAIEVPGA